MEVVPEPDARASPSGLVLAVAIALGLFTFLLAGSVLQAIHPGAGLWVSGVFCFVGLPALVLKQAGWSPVRYVALDGFAWRGALVGAAAGAINVFAWANPLAWACERLFPQSLVERFDQAQVFEGHTAVGLGLVLSAVSLAAPFSEEFLFRGLMQGAFARRLPPVVALGLTALLFSAFHVNPVAFGPLFEVGLLLGLLAWRSGSIWPGIFAHAANNVVSSIQYFATQGGASPSEARPGEVLTSFSIGNLLLVALVGLVWRRPALLSSPRPAEAARTEPGNVARLVRGGLAVMVLGYGAMVGLDFRGAEAHLADQVVWLSKLPADATSEQKAGRVVVEAERRKLLSGKTTFLEYLEERRVQQKREAE